MVNFKYDQVGKVLEAKCDNWTYQQVGNVSKFTQTGKVPSLRVVKTLIKEFTKLNKIVEGQ